MQLSELLLEIVSTNTTLRNNTSPKYNFDVQYSVLQKSLLLDGYQIENECICALDPNFEGKEPIEDALIVQLDSSTLQNKDSIKQAIKASADDFVKAEPDFNGSLTNIRIALETLVREIAGIKGFTSTRIGNTWGSFSRIFTNKRLYISKRRKNTFFCIQIYQ
jgi:hypothetical protein